MQAHWAVKYVGKRWKAGASGPDEFDCWGFIRAVYLELFKLELPVITPDNYAILDLLRAFDESEERKYNWTEVKMPREGDVILLGRARMVAHAGVYVPVDGGCILHCVQPYENAKLGGVVFQKVRSLPSAGWGLVKYVRHQSLLAIC